MTGVPGMGNGWVGPWVTAPSLDASDFGVTQSAEEATQGAGDLGITPARFRGALGLYPPCPPGAFSSLHFHFNTLSISFAPLSSWLDDP